MCLHGYLVNRYWTKLYTQLGATTTIIECYNYPCWVLQLPLLSVTTTLVECYNYPCWVLQLPLLSVTTLQLQLPFITFNCTCTKQTTQFIITRFVITIKDAIMPQYHILQLSSSICWLFFQVWLLLLTGHKTIINHDNSQYISPIVVWDENNIDNQPLAWQSTTCLSCLWLP